MRLCHLQRLFACLIVIAAIRSLAAADFDLSSTKKLFLSGQYEQVVATAEAAIEARERGEDWRLLHAHALWMLGRYPEAAESIDISRNLYYFSTRVRLLGHKIYRNAGDLESASEVLDEINNIGGSRRYRYSDPLDIVALGEAAVILGADPRLVLDNFFTPAKNADPDLKETYLAIGNLALGKHDFALAGKSFQEGLGRFPADPDLTFGLADALLDSDTREAMNLIEKVFEINPNHIEGHLRVADHYIDAEKYDEALGQLELVEAINPNRPEMWAYRGVIRHLRNDFEGEAEAREAGLQFWKNNPQVDHLLGLKISQKYRFAEGSQYQRRALVFDRTYLPAKIQLAQDLLRLGVEEEGWELADSVFRADAYDVAAYNLVTLRDTLREFVTLTNAHFQLRMSKHEAAIYGQNALNLLEDARKKLCAKYGLDLAQPVTVEIFPEQKDFAIRTFGMPGGEGYLGVCFGHVITANSPATHTMNWHSVLWHEFCHVITLQLTKNKMPRWFSEGISVYEERLGDPRWGEQINPKYRQMILEGEMKPIAELSSAFMAPPSGLHLQFAYYQSSLVVEFLVERYGLESVRAMLRDLGAGKSMNEALVERAAPMETLEEEFESFATAVAESLGPDTIWAEPKRGRGGEIDRTWAALFPDNYYVLGEKARELIEQEKWSEAIPLLEKSIEVYPSQKGEDNAYSLLALVYQKLDQPEKEREVLSAWTRFDPEATSALGRLIELETVTGDYAAVKRHADSLLAVNPVIPQPHRALAVAEEELGNDEQAITAYKTVLELDPNDPAEIHFRLARLLQGKEKAEARRHILLSLQDAPRFREGHKLLRTILSQANPPSEEATPRQVPENVPDAPPREP